MCKYRTGTVMGSYVTIVNDVGGTIELPAGNYRVRLLKTWDDYETGMHGAGELLDTADIATARRVGTTGTRPEDYRGYGESLYQSALQAARCFRPQRVYFPLEDFKPDA